MIAGIIVVIALIAVAFLILRRKPIESDTLDRARKQMVQMAYEMHLSSKVSSEWFIEFEKRVNQSAGIQDLAHRELELSLVREK